jgi:hypothetical protein
MKIDLRAVEAIFPKASPQPRRGAASFNNRMELTADCVSGDFMAFGSAVAHAVRSEF